jgi:hypothetical protein
MPSKAEEDLQRQLDAINERNELLLLENLRFKSNGPKLHKAVVRFSSRISTVRAGVATSLKQFGKELSRDFAELTKAVTAVDIATRVGAKSGDAERERRQQQCLELEALLQESQTTVQMQEGRLLASATELDRATRRAEELAREIASLERDSAVKDERIVCLEQIQHDLTVQVCVCAHISPSAALNPTRVWRRE